MMERGTERVSYCAHLRRCISIYITVNSLVYSIHHLMHAICLSMHMCTVGDGAPRGRNGDRRLRSAQVGLGAHLARTGAEQRQNGKIRRKRGR